MTNARVRPSCSAGRRARPESQLTQREMDLARSVQEVTEEAMLRMARHVHKETGERNLCLAGRRRAQLRRQRPHPARRAVRERSGFSRRRATRAARSARRSRSGISISANERRRRRRDTRRARRRDERLVPRAGVLRRRDRRVSYRRRGATLPARRARGAGRRRSRALLAEEKVVGWFQGRMEFGPRALGARSRSSATRARRGCSRR